ncbi:probable serine/threonine-protein kinase SIS8 isoform X2 [Diospyros lotus]|uniref:probable serine/threonine-protein kinase SIS8 isoform X2 n=1 Tax=Diospyros lotus TaxID=55363 RepID=UPI002258F689|nr:probable serine/threonine-protein kinase SIS8 isoform X2 [Diospyros lotus]
MLELEERRLKELFDIIPSFDDLYALRSEGLRADVILVDDKDKKLSMLKQLTVTLVKGLSSNPAAVIKKIAGLVYDFYKRSNLDASPIKIASEEVCPALDNQVVQMLGQIRHGTCHARAILFKVLADSVGLESRLVVGLPKDGVMERIDSHKHISVTVMMNSVELLVDLVHSPGQLMPCSTKAIIMSHISPLGDSDSADYDSCDSPLEPNSPLRAFAERHVEGTENNESLQSLYQCKLEASANASGPSLQNIMLQSKTMVDGKLNSSHSEPNIANAFWRRSQKKVMTEKSTASSSPEHPLHRLHGKSILSGHRDSYREYRKDMAASRSAGASPSGTRRRRRHSVCITPEIGDDIVRAVRAINEALKQNRFPREQGDARNLYSLGCQNKKSDPHESVSNFHPDDHDETPGEKSIASYFHREQMSSQKAFSLPSSPKQSRRQASGICHEAESVPSAEMTSTWSNVLGSSKNLNKLLLPFQEWYIDFLELTVGTRVGIGFFGEVFRGIWNGTDVAIKVFLVQDLTVENIEDFCNEISILSRLRHPNVILFLGACTKPPRLSIVTEYMEMGSLYHLIHMSGQKKRLSWRRRLKMLCDICRGLMYIHRMKIAHRDLKSANCLVDKYWTVKICDFGLSRVLTTTPTKDASSAGTPEWMAPELIRNEPFTEKCDIFSLGVLMWELCTLNRPWEGVPSVQVVYAVANDGSRLEIPEGPLGKLIAECWAEPDERPSSKQVLSRLLDVEYTLC